MSLWSKIIESISGDDRSVANPTESQISRDVSRYAMVDVEVGMKDNRIHDIGALRWDGTSFHMADRHDLLVFMLSKLIQSMDGFRFWNMAEVRLFLKYIDTGTHTPFVADDVWEEAKRKTYEVYATSESLHYLQCCIRLFEETNKAKYLTDFKEFVFESSVEDFCDLSGADVVVSTIHKSKGREFDDVYMLVTEPRHILDNELRRYYVGMTRAKKRLFIHTNSSIFDRFPADRRIVDQRLYEMPDEIMLQLSHKDVNLNFFKSRKNEVLALRAGEPLRFENNFLYDRKMNIPVAQLSQKMQAELLAWSGKGYRVSDASIRFIVAWRPKDAPKDEREHAVLLIDLSLSKS